MNAPINIVYPINGSTVPRTDPSLPLKSAYICASFSTTCAGGPHKVKWGFNGSTLGNARFYDELSEQQVWKLPRGTHVFWVESSCSKKRVSVRFKVGP